MKDAQEIITRAFADIGREHASLLAKAAVKALDDANIVLMWRVPCKTCEGTNVMPPGAEGGLGCWDCFDGTEIVAITERPWPGWCQNCGAKLYPPDARSCNQCFASDEDE